MLWLSLLALSLRPSVSETPASVTTLRIGNDQQTICTGVGGKDQECLTVKDFTQEELLSILEPLLTKGVPNESEGRPSWRSLCSLVVTMSTWALLFTCCRTCCGPSRQKGGRKTRQSCGLLRRWAGDLCDVFFTFPLMGAKMILGKVIAAPITAAFMALQDMQTEQTLRLQRQLLAAEGEAESSAPKKRERAAGSLLRTKRRSTRLPDKAKEPSNLQAARPIPVVPDSVVTVEEDLSGVDWCQVQRHSEHPKRSTEKHLEVLPAVPSGPRAEVRPDRSSPPREPKPSVKVVERKAAPGAPAHAPPPPTVRASCEDLRQVPSNSGSVVTMTAPPSSAPLLDSLENQEKPSWRIPPPDVPPPPCPGHLEPQMIKVSLPPPRRPVDMGCFSGGTGGTPGLLDALEVPGEQQNSWVEDVEKRLEAMVEDLAGPCIELDAFSKEALGKVVEPLRMQHTAPAFIPGQMWPGLRTEPR